MRAYPALNHKQTNANAHTQTQHHPVSTLLYNDQYSGEFLALSVSQTLHIWRALRPSHYYRWKFVFSTPRKKIPKNLRINHMFTGALFQTNPLGNE